MNLPKTILVLDTETIGLDKPFIYDIGFIVARLENGKYKPINRQQYLISEIYDNAPLFATAYYSTKRPLYEELRVGKGLEKRTLSHTMNTLNKTIRKFKVEGIFAYNSRFDNRAINFTNKFFGNYNPISDIKWYDIQKIANIIHKTPEYIEYCDNNGFVGDSGYIQTNAERTYSFLTKDPNYVEPHMGLQDCEIELDIINHSIDYGFNDIAAEIKGKFIIGNTTQTLIVEHNGEVLEFDYNKRINRKGNRIVLS